MLQMQRYDTQTFLLHIDEFRQDEPVGRFHNPSLGETDCFSSTSQLILKINSCLDLADSPQSFLALRSFSPNTGSSMAPADISTQPGKAANLVLRILFRSNASWQGTITWVEKQRTQRFRSVLELINLITSTAAPSRKIIPHTFSFQVSEYSDIMEG